MVILPQWNLAHYFKKCPTASGTFFAGASIPPAPTFLDAFTTNKFAIFSYSFVFPANVSLTPFSLRFLTVSSFLKEMGRSSAVLWKIDSGRQGLSVVPPLLCGGSTQTHIGVTMGICEINLNLLYWSKLSYRWFTHIVTGAVSLPLAQSPPHQSVYFRSCEWTLS